MLADSETLQDWRNLALKLEAEVKKVMIGQGRAIRLLNIAIFARGHVLLEGDVGVGKTTLLQSIACAIGGAYERIEGSIDLMPSDLVYYTYISEDGKPRVAPGPLLKYGDSLATFFFNEVNRARPQMHSLLLRVMAERSVTAFNREYSFPHLQVFADRNRVEKEETFEIPSAARDRFLMEVLIEAPDGEGGVYRSDDAGETWDQVNTNRNLQQRAWYYTHIYADPVDENTVYALNVNLWKSIDGGRTFESVGVPHGDTHDLWINPTNPYELILGTDGVPICPTTGAATSGW